MNICCVRLNMCVLFTGLSLNAHGFIQGDVANAYRTKYDELL